MSSSTSELQLAMLASECRSRMEYDAALVRWLEQRVPCDTIYIGSAAETLARQPIVTGVDTEYTASCEAKVDRYWNDRRRLHKATLAVGGVALDVDVLSLHERERRFFYREIVSDLGLRVVGVAVATGRSGPSTCIYLGWTRRRKKALDALRGFERALPILALADLAFPTSEVAPSRDFGLSARDQQIGNLVVRGLTNHEISKVLGTSRSTVKNQIAALLRKLGVANRTELAWRLTHDDS